MGYELVSSRRTTQVLSPTKTVDVMLIGVMTLPSLVFFERAVLYKDWLASPAGSDFYAIAPSDNIETALASGSAVAATYIEDLDPSGLVKGYIEFVLEVPPADPTKPGPFQTTVDIPIEVVSAANLGGGGMISATYNNALAALQVTAAL